MKQRFPRAPAHEFGKADAGETALLLEEKEDIEGDDGALEAGGEIDVFAFERIGYLCQYLTVGLLQGSISGMGYGLYICYLNVPSYVNASQSSLIEMAWSLKVLFALVSDSCPIFGLRRKPYMAIGWSIAAMGLLVVAAVPLPDPYYCKDASGRYDTHRVCNPEAAGSGALYAGLLATATCGYMLADVSADALTVQYARREPLKRRGSTQTLAYLGREVGSIASSLLVGFGMNGPDYNGSFAWGLSFNFICGLLGCVVLVQIPISIMLIEEPRPQTGAGQGTATLSMACSRMGTMLQSGATFEYVLYLFLGNCLGGISTTASSEITRQWAKVENLQYNLFKMGSGLLFILGLWATRTFFLNSSWRMMILLTSIIMSIIDAPFTFLTIFDVVRNQYFFLDEILLVAVPKAASFVVGVFVIVELAEEGSEGLAYGLLTTLGNLGNPVSTVLSNLIFGHFFHPSLSNAQNYIDDTPSFRWTVASSYLVSYIFSFGALLLLPLLPNQKDDAQERKRTRPRSKWFAVITVALAIFAFLYSLTVNVLTIFPSTACLEIAGGEGCDPIMTPIKPPAGQ